MSNRNGFFCCAIARPKCLPFQVLIAKNASIGDLKQAIVDANPNDPDYFTLVDAKRLQLWKVSDQPILPRRIPEHPFQVCIDADSDLEKEVREFDPGPKSLDPSWLLSQVFNERDPDPNCLQFLVGIPDIG